ncbi:MAG TPA: pyruvate kinase [Chthonomonadaceae bacterium]|nr:pyruvate kinase [Chthonomonadaceae bacterium]
MPRTKIVCTIGPASSPRAVLEKLLRAGMDVARLNFSHGTHEEHARVIASLRDLAQRMGKPLAILQDLSGPKVRLGAFGVPSVTLKRGQEVGFAAENVEASDGAGPVLPLSVPELLTALKPGNTLLLDDGKIALRVVRTEGEPHDPRRIVWARCLVGGELKPHKGVTAPGVHIAVPAVTEKDKDDLRFGLAQGVDWVAASYVRCAADLEPLREIMAQAGRCVPLIAKIEKREAVRNLDSILEAVDGIMVARGDLGVEMPFDEVPLVQKRLIGKCNRAGKPVITATQMLESMIQNSRPTRAEATDVANAILDGTDAVMLSGETAVGQFPVEAVRTMARIAHRAEEALFHKAEYDRLLQPANNVTEVVARASGQIACDLDARAILCATTSGGTARMVAKYRPNVPILGVTTTETTYRQLALIWGVDPVLIGPVADTDTMLLATIEAAQRQCFVRAGDRVILTAGVPVNNPGTTNLIKVHTVGQPLDPKPALPTD